ncbi:MAG TPA: hypothetical protein DD477_03650 [Spirochaetaceae bacterium]|nr:hypothetical protein [Spirochaetaceae bacterium]HAW84997.1 hypothetical protein [Spirochaetaceae bacterium]HAX37378.1 hypothetical protein [Spirochaetaceae bacterium]HBO40296.1 hypothetical protein [Spirochaetaceae bacterium]HCQ87753.1 hypothetical protein [Spirochaetaceae bacterium]
MKNCLLLGLALCCLATTSLAAQIDVTTVPTIGWADSLHDALEAEPAVGELFAFYLEPTKGRPTAIWGSEIYTSDSSIGWAAVHDGYLNPAEGGVVVVEILPGRGGYMATTRNGVTSLRFGSWNLSFSFVSPDGVMTVPGANEPVAIDWSQTADDLGFGDKLDLIVTLMIPPAPYGSTPASIWGSDVYSSDSPIAWAAVHAGIIRQTRGGIVTIQILGGQASFAGSTRYGVTSADFGSWDRSYQFWGQSPF